MNQNHQKAMKLKPPLWNFSGFHQDEKNSSSVSLNTHEQKIPNDEETDKGFTLLSIKNQKEQILRVKCQGKGSKGKMVMNK